MKIALNRNNLLKVTEIFSEEEGCSLLYSGGSQDTAKKSFLTLFPFDRIWVKGTTQYRQYSDGSLTSITETNPWDTLQQWISINKETSHPEWIGFIGYEMGAYTDKDNLLALPPASTPDAYFQSSCVLLIVDHEKDLASLHINQEGLTCLSQQQQEWVEKLSKKEFWEKISDDTSESPEIKRTLSHTAEGVISYTKKVEKIKNFIRSGDVYQVNLSLKHTFKGHYPPFPIFKKLTTLNPTPFAAYLRLKDFAIISASPERFLKCENGRLETRPIKGTAPRGKTEEEDLNNKQQLYHSLKERSELLMITDLMRNDLGKISLPGSVKMVSIFHEETYATVFHLLSIIQSKALPHLHPIEMIRSTFPGGSITGCPKLSAMEFIKNLEERPRGIYTGSIGYFSGKGDFDFNIAIRTLVIWKNYIDLQLGGGIVIDSDPFKEFEETQYKGASILKILNNDPSLS